MGMAWPVDRSTQSAVIVSGQGTTWGDETHTLSWHLISDTRLSLLSHLVCWNPLVQDRLIFYLVKHSGISFAYNPYLLPLTGPTLTHSAVSAHSSVTPGQLPGAWTGVCAISSTPLCDHPSATSHPPLSQGDKGNFREYFLTGEKKLVAKVWMNLGNNSQFKGVLF